MIRIRSTSRALVLAAVDLILLLRAEMVHVRLLQTSDLMRSEQPPESGSLRWHPPGIGRKFSSVAQSLPIEQVRAATTSALDNCILVLS